MHFLFCFCKMCKILCKIHVRQNNFLPNRDSYPPLQSHQTFQLQKVATKKAHRRAQNMSSQLLSKTITEKKISTGKAKYQSVMLIDDNSLDNFINKKMIESNGFAEKATTFQEAGEALQFLKTSEEAAWPEIIFLDIMMPEMDGFMFLDEFEKLPENQRTKIKIVMLSTSESFRDLNRANKNPFVRKFLNKPLTQQVLQAINV